MDDTRKNGIVMLVVATGVVHGLLLFLWLATMLFAAPMFGAMFADFGVVLPAPTQMALDMAQLLQHYALVLVPGFGLLIAGSCLAARGLSLRRNQHGWLWFGLVTLLLLMAEGVLIASLYLPIVRISQEM